MAEEWETWISSGPRNSAGQGSNHSEHLQTQQEIEEKNSSNSMNRKATTFWKVGCAEK